MVLLLSTLFSFSYDCFESSQHFIVIATLIYYIPPNITQVHLKIRLSFKTLSFMSQAVDLMSCNRGHMKSFYKCVISKQGGQQDIVK